MPHYSYHGADMDQAYQRYLLLSNQQDHLRRRLSLQIPTASPMTVVTSEESSLPSSPTGYNHRMSCPCNISPSAQQAAYSSRPVPPVPVASSVPQPGEDNKALYDINQQIKATLTELLNTDSVKHDEKFRAWIQSRLMDAEMELKRQRRRRSSASVDGRGIAESIAGHIDPHHGSFRW